MATTNVTIRMDAELKASAEELFESLGMNLSTAFNVFLRQSIREQGIPFRVGKERPSPETLRALLEAERIAADPSVPGYRDAAELFSALRS